MPFFIDFILRLFFLKIFQPFFSVFDVVTEYSAYNQTYKQTVNSQFYPTVD